MNWKASTLAVSAAFVLGAAGCKKQPDSTSRPAEPGTNTVSTPEPPPVVASPAATPAQSNALPRQPVAAATAATANSVPPAKREYPANDIYEEASILVRKGNGTEAGEQALKLFRQAAEAGHPAAQHALGLSYLSGIGVEKSVADALNWFQKSADQNYPDGLFKLASMYAHGNGVPEDRAKAAELARRAAEQGHTEAQYNLGTLYVSGRGVPQDMNEAAKWFRLAAEGGHPTAQSNLGVLFAEGRVVEKNMGEAVKWWRQAAEQGQRSAQFNLAQVLQEGKDAPKDLVEAYKWYSLAADQGDREAAALRNRLGVELSPTEVADALKRAREFKSALVVKWEQRVREEGFAP